MDCPEVPFLPAVDTLQNDAMPTIRDFSGTWCLDRDPEATDQKVLAQEPQRLGCPVGRIIMKAECGEEMATDAAAPGAGSRDPLDGRVPFAIAAGHGSLKYDPDAMDMVFRELGVGQLARFVLYRTDMRQQLVRSKTELFLHELSVNVKRTLLLDSKWRATPDNDGSQQRCWNGQYGEVVTETLLPGGRGTMFDQRVLVRRDLLRHDIVVVQSRQIVACATSFLRRQETAEDKLASIEAEQWARSMATHAMTGGTSASSRAQQKSRRQESKVAGKVTASSASVASGQHTEVSTSAMAARRALDAVCDPVQCNYSGTWANVPQHPQSENIDGLLTALGVPWLARGLAASLVVRSKTEHRRGAAGCEDQEVLAGISVALESSIAAKFDALEAIQDSKHATSLTSLDDSGRGNEDQACASTNGQFQGAASGGAMDDQSDHDDQEHAVLAQCQNEKSNQDDGAQRNASIGPGVMVTVDTSSFGSNTSAIVLDGVPRRKTGDDGKSTVCRAWIGRTGGGGPRCSLVCMHGEGEYVFDVASPQCDAQLHSLAEGEVIIEVVLPDDKGVTIDRRTPFWIVGAAMLNAGHNAEAKLAQIQRHPHGPFPGFYSTTTLVQYADGGGSRSAGVMKGAMAGHPWTHTDRASSSRPHDQRDILQQPHVRPASFAGATTSEWTSCKVTTARRISECVTLADEQLEREREAEDQRSMQALLDEKRESEHAIVPGDEDDVRADESEYEVDALVESGPTGGRSAALAGDLSPQVDISGLWAADFGRSSSPQAMVKVIEAVFQSAAHFRRNSFSSPPVGMEAGEAETYLRGLKSSACRAGPGIDADDASRTVYLALPHALDLVLAAGGSWANRKDRAEAAMTRLHFAVSRFRLECRMARMNVLNPGVGGSQFASIPPVNMYLDGKWRAIVVSRIRGDPRKMYVRGRSVYSPFEARAEGAEVHVVRDRDSFDVVVEIVLPMAPIMPPAVLASSLPLDASPFSGIRRQNSGVTSISPSFAGLGLDPPVGIGIPSNDYRTTGGDSEASVCAWPDSADAFVPAPVVVVSHMRMRVPPGSTQRRGASWMQQSLHAVRAMEHSFGGENGRQNTVLYDMLASVDRVWVRDESVDQTAAGEAAWQQQEAEWSLQKDLVEQEAERQRSQRESESGRVDMLVTGDRPNGAGLLSTTPASDVEGSSTASSGNSSGLDTLIKLLCLFFCLGWSAAVLWRLQARTGDRAEPLPLSTWSSWAVGAAGGLAAWALAEVAWPTCRNRCVAHAAEVQSARAERRRRSIGDDRQQQQPLLEKADCRHGSGIGTALN